MSFSRLFLMAGAVVLGVGALLLLLVAFWQPSAATVLQTPRYVDGVQGNDTVGCGVGTGFQACKTIQYAINAGYDVISVTAGIYTESIRTTGDLTLQGGWNSAFTVWDPDSFETTIRGETGTGVDAVTIATGTVALLDSLTIFQGGDGVELRSDAEARLFNLQVHGADDEGIESNGARLIVSNTEIFDTGDNGIFAETGSAQVYSSTVHHTGLDVTKNSRRGIYLRGGGPDLISNTHVYSTPEDGIRARHTGSVSLFNNRVYWVSADALQLDDASQAWVEGNTVYAVGKDGIRFDSSGRATVRLNTVRDVVTQGIQIQGSGVVTVEANDVYRTGADGILAENSGGTALIQGNTIYSTTKLAQDGVHVDPGVAATVKNNIVYSMTGDGIDFKGASGVVEDNLVFAVNDVGVQISGTASVSVAHNTIRDANAAGVQVDNSGMVWIAHNAVSRTVTGTAAIYVGPGVAATIDHNTVYSAAADGVNFQGTTGLIRYNRVHQVGDQGINVNADNTTVLSNTVHDTQGEGLRVRSGSTILIQDNVIYNVLGANKDGIRVEPNVTATIVGNEIYDAVDDGITFNGAVGTISENSLHDNGASGLDVDAERVTVVANQIFNNGLVGIELEQAGSFEVMNNLIGENASGGVLVVGASQGQLVNNTLVGGPLSPVGVGVHVLSDTVTLTSANNIIVSHTTGISVAVGAWVTTTFDDVWSNGMDYRGISAGVGSLQQDPLLANVVGRDYHLRLGSPCFDAGWSALAPPLDFEGEPRFEPVDIGADELLVLTLVKSAPAAIGSGESLTYTIVVTNHLDVTVTNVVVTDAVPVGAHLVSVPSGTLLIDQVRWVIDQIDPDKGTARVSFVVTATETITNDRYRVVTSTQGFSTGFGPTVVTTVGARLYLPVVLRQYP